MHFPEILRARRESLGLSVAVAAARAGVEAVNYRAWEAGRRTPAPERQAVVLAALEVEGGGAAGDFRDGALWALAALHETLGRLYRELAERPTATAAATTAGRERAALLAAAEEAERRAAASGGVQSGVARPPRRAAR
jgi:transcriptional regulator with XRE-family HTH domain